MFKRFRRLLVFSGILFQQAAAQEGFAVVELFTSQSDPNAVVAGSVIRKLQERYKSSDVHFLEYHVDYWNRSVWMDPYSRRPFTLRQENYSRVLPGHEMYTPQLVINGIRDITGTDSILPVRQIDSLLKQRPTITLSIRLDSLSNDTAYIRFFSSRADKNLSVRIAMLEEGLSNSIEGGPNKGQMLYQGPIVRRLVATSLREGEGMLRVPVKEVLSKDRCVFKGFIQHKQTMQILAVAVCRLQE